MAKASLGLASLLVIFLLASCVSNSVAQSDAKCTRDIECAFTCKHGGFCDLKTGKCSCLPAAKLDKECSRDIDCDFRCKQAGLCDLETGKCICLPPLKTTGGR